MGGFIAPSTTIGGTVLAPGIPLQGAPLTGLYELPGLNGAGFAVNALNYWTLTALGFTFGNAPVSPFALAAAAVSPATVTLANDGSTISPDGRFVFCANSLTNQISVFSRNPVNCALTPIAGSPFAAGTAVPSPAYFAISPDGVHLYMSSAAAVINGFTINQSTGALTGIVGFPMAITPGTNSFGMSVSPDGTFVAVVRNDNKVLIFTRNAITGALTPVAGSPFAVGATPLNCTISPDNAHVLVVNNTGNSVSVFSVNQTTKVLTPVAGSPFATGNGPVDVKVSPDGTGVVVANNTGNSITVFTRAQSTGVLAIAVGSPYLANAPVRVAFMPDSLHLMVANNGNNTMSAYLRTPATNALAPIAGSPFAATNPYDIYATPDASFVMSARNPGTAIDIFATSATPTYNLLNAVFDPTGGLGGALYLNGTLFANGVPVSFPAMGVANAGKFLRVNTAGAATQWDGVNTYTPVAMVANAGAFTVDDTAEYIIEVTGVLTGNGALTATFTVPADPLKVVFDNLTTGGFPLILNATYTIPPGRSLWYWNGATLERITPAYLSINDQLNLSNLNFTGTGNRITGDFSNATVASQTLIQTSTVNGATIPQAIPNGTSKVAGWWGVTGTTANESFIGMNLALSGAEARFSSGIYGAGTYLPMTFYTGGAERMRIDTSGNVGIGNTPAAKLQSFVTGAGSQTALNLVNGDTAFGAGTGPAINFGIALNTVGVFGKIEVLNQTAAIGSNSYMAFSTRGGDVLTERMRIDAFGNVTLGGTSTAPALKVVPVASQTAWVTVTGSNGGNPTIGTSAGGLSCSSVFFPQQATTVGAPAYVLGGMYFDTTLNKLRIGGATGWETVTSA